MPTKLKVYVNEDDALLFWSISKPIAGCRGFAIEREKTNSKGKKTKEFLMNRIGFAEDAQVQPAAGQEVLMKPSTEWPIQRFSWTDHGAETGDAVSYRVIPVIRNSDGELELLESQASASSKPKVLGASTKGPFKPFFNRGFVMSQFMARFLSERKLTLKEFKKNISDKDDQTIRQFLAGDLRRALLDQMKIALKEKTEVYAALFELSDDELITALCALGDKAHVVLANGSVQKKPGETMAQARLRDENKSARKRLTQAGVNVAVPHRFLSPGALGHNKFLIRMGKDGKPLAAWTGSTNWAPTGLCTQVNNGLLVEDRAVAQIYFEQWHRLLKAESLFPKDLLDANSQPKHVGEDKPGKIRSTVWFTRTKNGVDLDALRAEVAKAKEGILFLMFMPGPSGILKDVTARSAEPDLYVRGVVSTLPGGPGDESAVDVNLVDGKERKRIKLDIIQPAGGKKSIAKLAEEITRREFLDDVGHAIIHSKVLVIDPFSKDPVVITGSHNFSSAASSKNDENFIIIKGDRELAEAYAVNIMGAYAHYRWRAFVAKTNKAFGGLRDNDKWQASMLAGQQRDLRFWGV